MKQRLFFSLFLCAVLAGCSSDSNDPVPEMIPENSPVGEGLTPASLWSCDAPNVPADCVDVICRAMQCGSPDSILDGDGCYRKTCTADADCDGKTTCTSLLSARVGWGRDPDSGECLFLTPSTSFMEQRCMPTTEPASGAQE